MSTVQAATKLNTLSSHGHDSATRPDDPNAKNVALHHLKEHLYAMWQCELCQACGQNRPEVWVVLKMLDKSHFVYDRPSGGIDQHSILLHYFQPLSVDQVLGLVSQGTMQTDNLCMTALCGFYWCHRAEMAAKACKLGKLDSSCATRVPSAYSLLCSLHWDFRMHMVNWANCLNLCCVQLANAIGEDQLPGIDQHATIDKITKVQE